MTRVLLVVLLGLVANTLACTCETAGFPICFLLSGELAYGYCVDSSISGAASAGCGSGPLSGQTTVTQCTADYGTAPPGANGDPHLGGPHSDKCVPMPSAAVALSLRAQATLPTPALARTSRACRA